MKNQEKKQEYATLQSISAFDDIFYNLNNDIRKKSLALSQAVVSGDLEKTKQEINKFHTHQDILDYSLAIAAKAPPEKQIAIYHFLLSQKANPNARDSFGRTALTYSVMFSCNPDCIHVLLAAGAQLHPVEGVDASTALMVAIDRFCYRPATPMPSANYKIEKQILINILGYQFSFTCNEYKKMWAVSSMIYCKENLKYFSIDVLNQLITPGTQLDGLVELSKSDHSPLISEGLIASSHIQQRLIKKDVIKELGRRQAQQEKEEAAKHLPNFLCAELSLITLEYIFS